MFKHAFIAALACAALAACTKTPEPPSAAPGATAQPAAQASAAATAAASASSAPTQIAGNPDAAKDPVFNPPPQPALDAAKTKGEFDKIVAESLK